MRSLLVKRSGFKEGLRSEVWPYLWVEVLLGII